MINTLVVSAAKLNLKQTFQTNVFEIANVPDDKTEL